MTIARMKIMRNGGRRAAMALIVAATMVACRAADEFNMDVSANP